MSTGFLYADDSLVCDGVALEDIAARFGTPTYVYSEATIEANWRAFEGAVGGAVRARGGAAQICYALKANPHLALLSHLQTLGAGADLVSGGELARALAVGIVSERIVFSGVAKRDDELAAALDAGILQFNIEDEGELASLNALAAERGVCQAVALRLKPEVAAATHDKTATGRASDKFGLSSECILRLAHSWEQFPALELAGLAVHIGSQLESLQALRHAWSKTIELGETLCATGRHALQRLDLGGGLGLKGDLAAYAEAAGEAAAHFAKGARARGCERPLLLFEPGRRIVGNAGGLLTRVVRRKEDSGHRFILLDAAMNDLIRPALYGAEHRLLPVRRRHAQAAADALPLTLAGPVCETGDTFAHALVGEAATEPAMLEPGELALFEHTGAYGATMASSYNTRPRAAEVLVRQGTAFEITARESVEALLARERKLA